MRPKISPVHHLQEPHCLLLSPVTCSSPSSSTLFLTLYLWNSFLCTWWFGYNFFHVIFDCIFYWVLFDLGWKERGGILIWIDWFALNWDCGLVNFGTDALCVCWLSWQNKIQILLHLFLSFQNLSPLSPSTSSHRPLSLISFHHLPSSTPAYFLIYEGNCPLTSPYLHSSLNLPLLPSPPIAIPDFGLSVLDYNESPPPEINWDCGQVNCHTIVSFMDDDTVQKGEILNTFHFNIDFSYFHIWSTVDLSVNNVICFSFIWPLSVI